MGDAFIRCAGVCTLLPEKFTHGLSVHGLPLCACATNFPHVVLKLEYLLHCFLDIVSTAQVVISVLIGDPKVSFSRLANYHRNVTVIA